MLITLSFLLGGLLALLVMYYGYFQNCKSNWEKQGYHTGYLTAQSEIAHKIKNEFGEEPFGEKSKRLFSIKDTDVMVITVDGVKTVRVTP